MPRAAVTVDEALSQEPQADTPPVAPAGSFVTKDEINSIVASAVASALAGAIPELVSAMSETKEPTFGPGMGPSENVFMTLGTTPEVKADYIKHYRCDGTVSGKFQELNMDLIDAGMDLDDEGVVMKGNWVHFQNDHFYAWTDNQVRFLDWKIRTDPGCRIYVSEESAMLPCTASECFHVFATQAGLMAHLRATHGVGR